MYADRRAAYDEQAARSNRNDCVSRREGRPKGFVHLFIFQGGSDRCHKILGQRTGSIQHPGKLRLALFDRSDGHGKSDARVVQPRLHFAHPNGPCRACRRSRQRRRLFTFGRRKLRDRRVLRRQRRPCNLLRAAVVERRISVSTAWSSCFDRTRRHTSSRRNRGTHHTPLQIFRRTILLRQCAFTSPKKSQFTRCSI